MRHAIRFQPVGKLEQVGRHRPERPNLLDRLMALTRHDNAGHDRLLMDVHSAAPFIDHFHGHHLPVVRFGRAGYPLSTDFAMRASPKGATLGGASGPPGQLKSGLSAPMRNRPSSTRPTPNIGSTQQSFIPR